MSQTTPWRGLKHSANRRQRAQARARLQEAMRAEEVKAAQHQGSPETLLAARATQQMLNLVREEFDTALLQARRDGWSLRALSDATGLSYTSVKRYSLRAVDRGH